MEGIKTTIKKYKYNEKAFLSIFFFILMLFATNQIILSILGVYSFNVSDAYYSLFSILVIALTLSLSEKLIAKRYHLFTDIHGRAEWLYSFVLTFAGSLLGLPLVLPLIKSARYSRSSRKLAALREGPTSIKERSHILLFNTIVLLLISTSFVFLFRAYNILAYGEASSFLLFFLMLNFVPYRHNDGIMLFYHNKDAYFVLLLFLVVDVVLLLTYYFYSLYALVAFGLAVLVMLRLRLF